MTENSMLMVNFIVFEGLDGSGKSTLIRGIENALTKRGRSVFVVTDPPRIDPWQEFKRYFEHGQRIDKIAEAFMLVAARVDNSNRVIREALNAGNVVLADRYYPSWLAYQQVRLSEPMGLENARRFLRAVQTILESHNLIIRPDRIIFLEGDLNVFARRLQERGEGSKYDNIDFQRMVEQEYKQLLQIEECQVLTVNTVTLSVDETVAVILSRL